MGSNNYSLKIIADVFPPWHCDKAHLNAAAQHTTKTFAFTKVLRKVLDDDQLQLRAFDKLLLTLSVPLEAVHVYLVLHFILVFIR